MLIDHGADPLIENEQGHLPSAYALQQRKELLSQFEKNVCLVKLKFLIRRIFISRRKNYMKKGLKLNDDDDHLKFVLKNILLDKTMPYPPFVLVSLFNNQMKTFPVQFL